MTTRSIAIALAAFATVAITALPAFARGKHRVPPPCVDRPANLSLGHILFGPRPEPNGCAPPVFIGGTFMGQDPDPNVRLQLLRDPDSGHASSYTY